MPKGKKKGKKGKDKGGKKKEAPPPPVKIEELLSDYSKEFYLIQIHDLEQRVTRYQTKCDTLTVTNEDLNNKVAQQIEDQEHIIGLLKKKMQELSEKCIELDDQLTVEKHEHLNEADKLTKEMALIKEEAQDRLDQLVAENTILHGTLESLEDFKLNKERIEAELKGKQLIIEKQQKEFKDKMYQLEKQAVLDKDRLRKEMVTKVSSVASEFRKVSDLQMADTTKRTIQENISITQQLHRMADKTAEMIRENEKLKEREKQLTLRLEMIEANERNMTRKNVSNQKILVMMKDKVKMQEDVIRSLQEYKDKCESMERSLSDAQYTSVITTQQTEQCKAELKTNHSEYEKLKELYAKTKEELETLKNLLSKTSDTIKSFINEPGDVSTSQLLPTLFELLLKTPNDCNNSTTTLIGSSSYQPGDLNIVPQKHRSSITRLAPLNPMKS